jgi:hypothetical protein
MALALTRSKLHLSTAQGSRVKPAT